MIKRETFDNFVVYEDEWGVSTTIMDKYIAEYALDGNRKYIYESVKKMLDNYDILGNDEKVDSLINDLEKLK